MVILGAPIEAMSEQLLAMQLHGHQLDYTIPLALMNLPTITLFADCMVAISMHCCCIV